MEKTKGGETSSNKELKSVAIATGLVVASIILLPALSQRLGMGSSLTSALRMALMRASHKA
ncbi:MAG: hypothetical protein U9Q81_20500 [Pseudomonadota bacterium]|nr:hypothetical protein [Pseudomonadota bacterium]